jgi:hypothetical protein
MREYLTSLKPKIVMIEKYGDVQFAGHVTTHSIRVTLVVCSTALHTFTLMPEEMGECN